MPIEFDKETHCEDFVRLNEQWITEHFSIEEADRELAANPYQIVLKGGHIISLVERGRVLTTLKWMYRLMIDVINSAHATRPPRP